MKVNDWISIGEFAGKANVTVRTLRFYEEQGLITPARDPFNDRRRYCQQDLIAVQNITLLKKIGLSLREIRQLSSASSPDLGGMLALQLDLLNRQKQRLEETIQSVQLASVRVSKGEKLDLGDLCRLIRMTVMNLQSRKELYKNYLTPEQFGILAQEAEANEFDPEKQAHWQGMIQEAESLIGSDPAGPAAQDLARHWWAALVEKTGGDMDLIMNLKSMHDDMEDWPADVDRPFSTGVRDFMNAAITAYLKAQKEAR